MTYSQRKAPTSRRRFLQLAGLGGSAAALAACSGGQGAGTGGESEGGGSLTYRIWSASQQDAMRELAATFAEQSGHDVQVEVTPDDQYWQKMEAAATSNTLPDVFWMHARQFVLYAQNGTLRPIDDMIASAGIDLSQYPSILIDSYTYDGSLYALPRNFNLVGLWYNRALFDRAGVAYPDATWSWSTLTDAAAELTDESSGTYGFAAPLSGQTGYWNAIYQNEGTVISEDMTSSGYGDPNTIEALDFWTSFLRNGLSPSHQEMTETGAGALFQSGKIAMLFEGDWNAGTFAEDPAVAEQTDVAVLPAGRRKAVIMHGSGNVVAENTASPEAAADFVRYLASSEAQDIQSEMGASGPPSVIGSVDKWIETNPAFDLTVFKEQVDDAVLFPHSRDTTAWQALETQYLGPVWEGSADVSDAATELAAAMNDVLAAERR